MIVGTAGHIDHGKTTLVKALTGVDTDRLPEEKRRGISIELGYAFLPVPGEPPGARTGPADAVIGFIDVPGHERLVHTMLAGATGIDLALLLVAADDGVMPQTREHLAVLSLLGLRRGAVVLTKADRADAQRLASVRQEVLALVQGSALQEAPVFTVAATTGQGVADLRDWLCAQARLQPPAGADGRAFRLAVDRAFTLDGVGTVVTGTVHAGQLRVGDDVQLVPGGPSLRVRSLRAQNREVALATAGQRCAVGLAGLAKDTVRRGQWLVGDGAVSVSERIDVQLQLWQGEAKALRSGTPVHVHLGAQSVLGTVALLDTDDALAPGQQARAQLVLRQPLGAWHGDRVVLRDASASRTLAGATVLDPGAPTRYRRTPERLAELAAQALPQPTQRLQALLASAPQGIDLGRWANAEGLSLAACPALPSDTLRSDDGRLALHAAQAERLAEAAEAALTLFHAKAPEELGPDAARLRRLAAPRLPDALWRALLAQLLSQGRLCQRGAFVHLPAHGVQLSATETRIGQKVAAALLAAGFEGAWVRDLARDHAEPEPLMRVTLARLAQQGELHQVVKDLFYPTATLAEAARRVREIAARSGETAGETVGEVTAAQFRDATGLGRKRAIQILEYFDRIGLLRRVGDTHRLRSDSLLFVTS